MKIKMKRSVGSGIVAHAMPDTIDGGSCCGRALPVLLEVLRL